MTPLHLSRACRCWRLIGRSRILLRCTSRIASCPPILRATRCIWPSLRITSVILSLTRRASPVTQERNAFAFRRTAKAVRSGQATSCFPYLFRMAKATKRASPATETARAARPFGVRRQSPACAGRRRRFCCMRAACANLRSRRHARAAQEKRRQAAALQSASPRPVRRKPNARNASSRWRAVQRAYATSCFP